MFGKLTDDHRQILSEMKNKARSPSEIASVRASLMRGYTIGEAEEKTKSLADRQNKRVKKTIQLQQPAVLQPETVLQPIQEVPVRRSRAKKQEVIQVAPEPIAVAPEPKKRSRKQPPVVPVAETPVAPEPKAKPKAKSRAKKEDPNNSIDIIM